MMQRLRMVDDAGDTLVEVLLALAIVAVSAVALIGSVLTGISASSEHRTLADSDTYLRSYADAAAQQIQRQNNPLWHGCASSYAVTAPSDIPASFTIGISTIQYWNGGSWSSTCAASSAPQLITIAVTSPSQLSQSLSFVVRSPS